MILKFSIDFNTKWGEELYITGSSVSLGNYDISKALKLSYCPGGKWVGEINCNLTKERIISYRYFVKSPEGIYYESGKGRTIALNSSTKEITAQDQWQGNSIDAPFLSAPFSEVFFADENWPYTQTHINSNELLIRVTVPNVPKGGKVLICGACDTLGGWNPAQAKPMRRMENLKWERSFSMEKVSGNVWEFKFIIQTPTGEYIWEGGENRRLTLPKVLKHNTVIKEFSGADFPVDNPRFSGVSIPVFSLRSESSHGIGDFADLRKLTDWAHTCGLSMIQLLPINDTTAHLSWRDSYPYNCISTLALHPIYINLEEVGVLADKRAAEKFRQEQQSLNKGEFMDYEAVWHSKMRYLWAIYEQEKENTFAEPGYYSFIKHNKEWVLPYGVFSALRDNFHTANFRQWGEFAQFSWELVERLSSKKSPIYSKVHFYLFVQYHLHKQMVHAKEHAHKQGVALKGDIPIGISRDSVEAWQYPHLFNFNQQAGAPPDAFSTDGQNWGFPTYNWEEMEKDNYAWWQNRFAHFAKYFDAYRIDHILGFFRIWEIPVEYRSGLMGHFYPALPLSEDEIASWGLADYITEGLFIEDPYNKGKYHPMIGGMQSEEFALLTHGQKESYSKMYHNYFYTRHNDFWYNNAMKKLQQLIASTNMLTCGEDLGMLNESVSRCMNNLKILSLELQIMPKEYGVDLGNPAKYPYLSVCTTSTHDCQTLRMWLGERNSTKAASASKDAHTDDAPAEDCAKVLAENLASPSMLAIFPLQDWMSIDGKLRKKDPSSERINIPAIADHYWRYRMHITIEELMKATSFNRKVKELASRRKLVP